MRGNGNFKEKLVELKRKHFWEKVRNRCSLEKCFGTDTVGEIWSDLAALMKVERWFELLGEPEGGEREESRRARAMAKASAAGEEVPGAEKKYFVKNAFPLILH